MARDMPSESRGAGAGHRSATSRFTGRLRQENAVFLKNAEVIERAADESLKSSPLQIHIFHRINAGLFRIAHRIGAQTCRSQ